MIGIIYKFTILARYKMDGHKPFYVGQHVGVNDFNNYWGSGKIWNNFLDRLKKDYPKNWMKLIRREVLYIHECSQKTLDKLEEYYIKKEKAHYSYKQGGCNVLWGTANKFGSGSPSKDPLVKKKISDKWKDEDFRKMMIKIHIGLQSGNKHPLFGKRHSEKSKENMSISHKMYYKNKGKYNLSESHKRNISISHMGSKNPMFGKKTSEETKEKIRAHYKGGMVVNNGVIIKYLKPNEDIPQGFVRGRKLTCHNQ